jgi:processive 1,2-diacylglycerol beta-glucosyltransferase
MKKGKLILVMLMRFLILSTATGQGHNSASLAAGKTLEARGCEAKVIDVLKLKNESVSRRVSNLYAGITIHTPRFFSKLYRIGEFVSSPGGHSPIYGLNTLYASRLLEEISRFHPDAIICPHIFSAQAVTHLRRDYDLKLPTAGLATDYTCIPFWEESSLDGYVIPHPSLTQEFASKGIPNDLLAPLGIPVQPEFLEHTPKKEARRTFNLTASHIFLVMGGSMGYGGIDRIAAALTEAVPDSQAVVLCGNNQELLHRLVPTDKIVPLTYTDQVAKLMDAADVVVTKPGGLSSTEAIAKRVPLVLTKPIPGCEQRNAEFLSSNGAAVFRQNLDDIVSAARKLALDENASEKMKKAQEHLRPDDTNERIADYLIALASRTVGRKVQ